MRFNVYEPTMLQAFTLCPEKFHLRYVEGLPIQANLPLFKGLIGHQILANPDEDPHEIFHAAVSNYRAGILQPAFDLSPDDEQKLHDDLITMITGWQRYVAARGIEILEREKLVRFTLAGRTIEGTIDIIYTSPMNPPGTVCLGDFKFGGRHSDRQMDRNLQHSLYYLGATGAGYKVHHNAWIAMPDLIPYKTDGKKAKKGENRGQVIYPIEISEVDIPWIMREAVSIIEHIDNEVRFKACYGTEAHCPMCDFANRGCSHLEVGRSVQYANDMVAMSQGMKEQALLKQMEKK